MNKIKKMLRWCPQPKYPVQMHLAKLPKPLLVFVLLAEIICLLIVPMASYAFLVPKSLVVRPDQTLPLTDSQIKAAWPNLPTAQQIFEKGDCSIVSSNTPAFNDVNNHTWISPVNAIPHATPPQSDHVFFTKLIPVEYFIWLQLNSTTWVCPGPEYLTTNNPPYVLSSPYYTEQVGFLGTGLSPTYVIAVIIVIIATLAIGTGYLVHKRALQKL